MKANLKLHTSQSMSMSPQLVAAIRLLQLSGAELEQEVATALESNPLVEAVPEVESEDVKAYASVVGDEVSEAAERPEQAATATTSSTGEIDIDDGFALADSWTRSEADDEEDSRRDRFGAATAPSLRAQLEIDLELAITSQQQGQAVVALLDAVDESGYLREEPAAVAARLGLPVAVVDEALALIRRYAPTGFAARNLQECLLLQLDEVRAGTPGKTLAEQLVMDHLEALGSRRLDALRQSLGVSPERFAAAMALIRSLNPKPGFDPSEDGTRYLVPDVLVTGAPGAWKVELNPATLPRVRLNSLYERALADAPHGRGLKEKLNEARWLVRGLEMRHETLLKTARSIFERQKDFLEQGEVAMKPLTLREVAQSIEMHESTVSRVTTNKFVATPWGTFELKHFFSVSLAGGEAEASGVAVRAMIRQLIDAENTARPLADGAISAILARKGVRVARRTVAKYREAMKIPAAPERKRERPAVALAV